MRFANQVAFESAVSRQQAMGVDTRQQSAVRDPRGNVLFQLQTGGIIAPQRAELPDGTALLRFAAGGTDPRRAMAGGWWTERASFDRILRFSQVHDVPLILAARILCGVPPEWSDMRLLVRVRVRRPLLAWRGLANSVVVPYPAGGPQVRMLHQNAAAERRLNQLFIPGLGDPGLADALGFEGTDSFSADDSRRGWIYV